MFEVHNCRFGHGEVLPLLCRIPHQTPATLPLIYTVLRRRHRAVCLINNPGDWSCAGLPKLYDLSPAEQIMRHTMAIARLGSPVAVLHCHNSQARRAAAFESTSFLLFVWDNPSH
jgi:hypothetical protein